MVLKRAGTRVKGGSFWDLWSGELVVVPTEGGLLPGGEQALYLRMPRVFLFFLGPFLGAIYVVLLPLLGFAAVGMALVYSLRRLVPPGGRRGRLPGGGDGGAERGRR